MKKVRTLFLGAWMIYCLACGAAVFCPTALCENASATTVCRMDAAGVCLSVGGVERRTEKGASTACVSLDLEGHEYRKNACIPAHIRMIAMEYGSFGACFAALSRRGADARSILDWAAYPLGTDIARWLSAYETQPVDAEVSVGRSSPLVKGHRDGMTVGDAALLEAVAACLDGGIASPLSLRYTPASVRTEELRARTVLLSTFSTPYAEVSNRVSNLRLASRALNGTVLPAGGEFSFNERVGERTAERGYLPAKVIADGTFTEGIGGGVCQVSTTLYNAAMLAGLRQVEVHQHSLAVHYVAPSRDAMVSGWSDLRFANDGDSPVYVFAEAAGGRVTVKIYGSPVGKVALRANSTVTERYRDVDEAGNLLSSTEGYELRSAGHDAIRSSLERTLNGVRETLRRNTYPRCDAVWTKRPDPPREEKIAPEKRG